MQKLIYLFIIIFIIQNSCKSQSNNDYIRKKESELIELCNKIYQIIGDCYSIGSFDSLTSKFDSLMLSIIKHPQSFEYSFKRLDSLRGFEIYETSSKNLKVFVVPEFSQCETIFKSLAQYKTPKEEVFVKQISTPLLIPPDNYYHFSCDKVYGVYDIMIGSRNLFLILDYFNLKDLGLFSSANVYEIKNDSLVKVKCFIPEELEVGGYLYANENVLQVYERRFSYDYFLNYDPKLKQLSHRKKKLFYSRDGGYHYWIDDSDKKVIYTFTNGKFIKTENE